MVYSRRWVGLLAALFLCLILSGYLLYSGLGSTPAREWRKEPCSTSEISGSGSGRQLALIIGNSSYRHINRLDNPRNDAQAMAAALSRIGFELAGGRAFLDVDRTALKQAIRTFGEALRGKQVGLFYYAGHGIQMKGRNYLLPISANIQVEDDIEDEAIALDLVLAKMDEAKTQVNILVLDACRNNPYTSRGFREVRAGLATITAPSGTFIAYATAPGHVAEDGKGSQSPYSGPLSKLIAQPGQRLDDVFMLVAREVQEQTGGRQKPWVSNNLVEPFFLTSRPEAVQTPPFQTAQDKETIFWQLISGSNKPEVFEEYLKLYPQGKFAALAQIKLKDLEPAKVTTPQETIPPPVGSQPTTLGTSVPPNGHKPIVKDENTEKLFYQSVPLNPSSREQEQIEEKNFWWLIYNSNRPEDFEKYLKLYPTGKFAPIAEDKLKVLRLSKKSTSSPFTSSPSAPVTPPTSNPNTKPESRTEDGPEGKETKIPPPSVNLKILKERLAESGFPHLRVTLTGENHLIISGTVNSQHQKNQVIQTITSAKLSEPVVYKLRVASERHPKTQSPPRRQQKKDVEEIPENSRILFPPPKASSGEVQRKPLPPRFE